ncbi:MAG: hypothetical protein SGCHY_002304 [Lobulomycetales sp.]
MNPGGNPFLSSAEQLRLGKSQPPSLFSNLLLADIDRSAAHNPHVAEQTREIYGNVALGLDTHSRGPLTRSSSTSSSSVSAAASPRTPLADCNSAPLQHSTTLHASPIKRQPLANSNNQSSINQNSDNQNTPSLNSSWPGSRTEPWKPRWQRDFGDVSRTQVTSALRLSSESLVDRVLDFLDRMRVAVAEFESLPAAPPRNKWNSSSSSSSTETPISRSTALLMRKMSFHEPIKATALGKPLVPGLESLLPAFSSTRSIPDRPSGCSDVDEDHLGLALQHHTQGQLQMFHYHLTQSASQDSAIGLYLLATSLCEGLGCPTDGALAFKAFLKAAQIACTTPSSDQLASVSLGRNASSSSASYVLEGKRRLENTSEAKLAVAASVSHQLGLCFRTGLGCSKSKSLAAYCFAVSSELGSVAGMMEFAQCLENGLGVEKNVQEAARWYRFAEVRGQVLVGYTWIHKEKYRRTRS